MDRYTELTNYIADLYQESHDNSEKMIENNEEDTQEWDEQKGIEDILWLIDRKIGELNGKE